MDIGKLLKNVQSLNEYISVTQDESEKCKTSRIQLNMSTVLALKKIRSLEIEYFNKCEDNGIACIIYERILTLPPSKTWGVLSKELVNLLQYWLDAIRKHLVRHNLQWWTFLKLLLKFIKEIRQKDTSLPNMLVEHTAECLLDLATNSRPDAIQRYEILHCFNMYCSESSREIRFALRVKFGHYFTKLSAYMASCGHLPTQYSIMETLLRWLLPRQDRTLRITSAAKWFPPGLYVDKDVDIFLERPWVNFFQDARDFLNAHNQRDGLITSVVCRKLTVGKLVIISGTERQESWLDINVTSRSMSVLLDPRVLESFGSTNHKSFETLVITHDNTLTAKLQRESLQLVLSVRTTSPLRVLPSCGDCDADCDVTAVVTTRCDVIRLNDALRKVFEDKYQVLLDLDKELERSPLKENINSIQNTGTEDARFSLPAEVKRRKHSGYIVKSRQLSCMSPSTASTSSLAQLHEKLAALPSYRYDKEPVSVCAHPELSIVTEVSEADDRQSLNTTLKVYKPYGVCQKNINKIENRKSQSDPETTRKTNKDRRLSPVVNLDTTSCLLVATIGSTDDSVINDTVERLSKNKDYNPDNIVDLLVKEALQAKNEDRYKSDSGINTGDKAQDSETIDNTPNIDEKKAKTKVQKRVAKVVSSTSDESNTEIVNETPCYVNTRRKNKKEVTKETLQSKSFDVQVVEEFFSQHFTENKVGEIVISPTLAKKINESSSETSENFGENFNLIADEDDIIAEEDIPYEFNNIEILECINSMVDKVCDDFDKCTKYFNENDKMIAVDNDSVQENVPLVDIINTIQDIASKNKEKKKSDSKKTIKLKYKSTPKKSRARATKKKNKLEIEPAFKMSTILEDNALETAEDIEDIRIDKSDEVNIEKLKEDTLLNETETTTPQIKRKRKLYSPKDEQIAKDSTNDIEDETLLSDLKIKKTPKSTATCYKEIEKDRQRLRMPRPRKSKNFEPPSPRTKKMNDMFDKIKQSANSEKVTLADKTFEVDVYNFTSDSDDDFKEKKLEISKRNSTTTLGSVESIVSKRGRRAVKPINYTDNRSSDESNKTKRKVTRRPRTKKKSNVKLNELVDEKMRKPNDVLDTSMVVEKTKTVVNEPDFVLDIAPEMEIIDEKKSGDKTQSNQKKKGKKKTDTIDSKRPKRLIQKLEIEPKNVDEDRTESPLPGLLVEPVTLIKDDPHELSSTMVDKFKKIYQDGPEKYINESNTTQNLLSDVERINYSPPDIDITEELKQIHEQVRIEDIECKKPKPKEIVKSKKAKTAKTNKKDKITVPSKTVSENIEVISIHEIIDIKSEKSIATIGITGHGELEEAPPSPKLINETLEPRNLEVEDLNNSMKDYFDKLTKEMDESNNRTSSGTNGRSPIISKVNSKGKSSDARTNSPVVSLKRLSPEDISRWLPSRRNSETDESVITEKLSKEQNTQENADKVLDSPKVPSNRDNDSDISEINEPKRKSLRLIYRNVQMAKTNDSSQSKVCNSETESEESIEIEKSKPKNTKVQTKKSAKTTEVKVKKAKRKPTSVISPIKLFEDLILSNADKQSETTLSDDDEYMKEIIHTLAKTKEANRPRKKIFEKTISPKSQKKTVPPSNVSSSHSKMSTSTKIEDTGKILKRRSEEDREDCKKKKLEVNNNVEMVSGSGMTVSSVDDWFKRNEPEGSRAEIISASMRHSMQNVMERLDTTLVEIHRNTSKKFVHLFVDVQKHLCELKEERQNLYKRLASDILSEVVKIMDEKFADLDKRSQELDGDFMKTLKERASELIREDCQQKRAMVRLLKEDVQAVMDHMDRQGAL